MDRVRTTVGLRLAAVGLILTSCATVTHVASASAPAPPPIELATPAPTRTELELLGDAVAAGRHWRIDAARGPIHVWVPRGYDPATAGIVVYVHGYYTDVDGAWAQYRLPEQFARAGINAMFIACAAPTGLDEPVRWPSLAEVLATAQAGTGLPLPDGQLIAIAHSGGFRTLTSWLDNRGLDTVVLLDGAYGEVQPFWRWTRASRDHRFIDVGDDTRAATDWLHRWLPSTVQHDGFPAEGTWPDDARAAQILYVPSTIGHMPLVTDGVALPMLLRALRLAPIPDVPWAPLDALPPAPVLAASS
jgi:hypothetical protein